MKKLLFVLFLLPTITFAQHLELSIAGGAGSSNQTKSNIALAPHGMVKAGLHILGCKIGLQADFRDHYFLSKNAISVLNNKTESYEYKDYKSHTPLFGTSIFIEKSIHISRIGLCLGLRGGKYFPGSTKWGSYTSDNTGIKEERHKEDIYNSGLLIGINASINYQVSNYIKVIAAVNPEYFRLNDDINNTTDKGTYIPVLLGITVSM